MYIYNFDTLYTHEKYKIRYKGMLKQLYNITADDRSFCTERWRHLRYIKKFVIKFEARYKVLILFINTI